MKIELDELFFSVPGWLEYLLITIIIIGGLLILLGVFGLSKTSSSFPSSASKNHNVMFSIGIYKYLRNPVYSGIFIVLLSYSFFLGSFLKIIVSIVLGFSFYLKSKIEEERLSSEYSNYKSYKNSTGRFFPKIKIK